MQNLPEVGKIYISEADPSFKIYVEKVVIIEADETCDAGLHIEGCDPKYIGKAWGDGIEMTEEEWTEYQLIPLP